MGDCGIVRDKPTVEVGEAKEGLYILDFNWGWPGSDSIQFDWVHGKLTGFYNHSKVFDFWDVKLTFLKF